MAWSWSHTHDAYENARNNLYSLPRETLNVIFAEWRAQQDKRGNINQKDSNCFNWRKYDRAFAFISAIPEEHFEPWVDFIWERASEFATCDNGGFNAWMCPYGCGCHTVSFDPTTSDE